jgi:PAS domain S-box-containing protein
VLRDLGARLAGAATRKEVMAALEACLAAEDRDLPVALAYLVNPERDEIHLAAGHRIVSGAAAPIIALDDPSAAWPIAAVLADGEPRTIAIDSRRAAALGLADWPHPPQQALALPFKSAEHAAPEGVLIAVPSPHRLLDDSYRGFFDLLVGQISAAISRADEYERERARAAALAELDRTKTAFFSNVSHEFRTPLTLMLGPLEDALSHPHTAAEQQLDRIQIAHRNALRLLRLVNSLLDFSRIEAGRVQACFQPVDLASFTADLASSFRSATAKAGLRLEVNASPLTQPAYVDRDMWEKIVLNLVSNAFKFTFEGEIAVTLEEAGDKARLSVRDTGTGIPDAELPRLFERFHRVEGARGRSFEGSGIGLALVHELVRQHGGDITVASEVGRGSTFTVTIPLGDAHLPAHRIQSGDGDASSTAIRAQAFVEEALRWLPGESGPDALYDAGAVSDVPLQPELNLEVSPARVLLADDNADLRRYMSRLLRERGYEVDTVTDGEAALAALRAVRPDLVISDVMMPRLDGFGLIRAIRSDPALRELPVIMLSARAGEEAKVEGLNAGANDYLIKPFSARELLARVAANIGIARVRHEADRAVRASEAEARRHAERLQLALDAGAIIGTWIWNVTSDKFVGDERFARSFGLDSAECLSGISLEKVMTSIHPEDREGVVIAIEEALKRGGSYRSEYRVRQYDNVYRWVEANGRVDLDANGAALRFPGVLIDIEHRRKIEEELRTINEQLEQRVSQAIAARERIEETLRQAQKMEAVGQLTGGVAHDFNNLLTIISGNIEIARRALAASQVQRAGRALDHAQRGAERAAALTQRLLAFSRRQPLAPKPINVDRLVAGMADLLHRSLGEVIQFETVSTPGLWSIEADPNQLENAILNLVVNGRDAMPEGGRLIIETANTCLDAQYSAENADVAPGEYVVIAVTDTGHGMSREILERVFDPFFTTKDVGKGTGLGLSMVYGFVKQSGGHIRIYSEQGEGTTVKIYLPRLRNGGEETAAETVVEVERRSRDGRILVVEDDDDVRAYSVEVLRELGYRVIEAHDGPSALRLMQRQEQPIDLLFTDVVMPGMSGRELAENARQLQPTLRVLFTSGYMRNAVADHGRLDPGVELIGKPFTYQALSDKIARILETSRNDHSF